MGEVNPVWGDTVRHDMPGTRSFVGDGRLVSLPSWEAQTTKDH